jgi:uncharacterized membrane protein
MTPMDRTLIALYDDVDDALATIEALVEMGFDREALSLCMRDPHAKEANLPETHKERAAASIERGALVGGVAGLLGIGAILAIGPLASAIAGTAVGAGAGALVGFLVGMGVDEDRAHSYAEAVRRGGILLVARVPEERWGVADDVLEQRHPVDIGIRAADWRAQGWVRFDPAAEPYPLAEEYERRRGKRRGE